MGSNLEFRECSYANLSRLQNRLYNARMNGQVIAIRSHKGLIVAQDNKDEPPPIQRVTAPKRTPEELIEDQIFQQELEDERQWELNEALEKTKQLSASFVNRAFVKMETRHLRISFGERVGDEDIYRSAIVMTPEDAYELGQLLMTQASGAYDLLLDHYRQALESLPPKDDSNA